MTNRARRAPNALRRARHGRPHPASKRSNTIAGRSAPVMSHGCSTGSPRSISKAIPCWRRHRSCWAAGTIPRTIAGKADAPRRSRCARRPRGLQQPRRRRREGAAQIRRGPSDENFGRLDTPMAALQRPRQGQAHVDLHPRRRQRPLRAASNWDIADDGRLSVKHGDSFLMFVEWGPTEGPLDLDRPLRQRH